VLLVGGQGLSLLKRELYLALRPPGYALVAPTKAGFAVEKWIVGLHTLRPGRSERCMVRNSWRRDSDGMSECYTWMTRELARKNPWTL
jgi:hypothetical protein